MLTFYYDSTEKLDPQDYLKSHYIWAKINDIYYSVSDKGILQYVDQSTGYTDDSWQIADVIPYDYYKSLIKAAFNKIQDLFE